MPACEPTSGGAGLVEGVRARQFGLGRQLLVGGASVTKKNTIRIFGGVRKQVEISSVDSLS